MSYCTQQDIEKLIPAKELARLTDDVSATTVVTTVVDDAIARSSSLIDSYCARVYQVPFAVPFPAVVVDICAVLSAYELQARRPQTMPEEWRKRREDLLKLLQKIGEGEVILPGAISASGNPVAAGLISFTGADRLFTRGSIR